jgi:hypothetical protein
LLLCLRALLNTTRRSRCRADRDGATQHRTSNQHGNGNKAHSTESHAADITCSRWGMWGAGGRTWWPPMLGSDGGIRAHEIRI